MQRGLQSEISIPIVRHTRQGIIPPMSATETPKMRTQNKSKAVLSSKTRRAQARKASDEEFLARQARKVRSEAFRQAAADSKNQITNMRWPADWGEQNAVGHTLLQDVLRDMLKFNCPILLHAHRRDLVDANAPDGVMVGYDHYLAETAMRSAYVR